MAAFGENLQREREMRGVSLEEISAATKISVRFLRAIEAEDFDALPGGVFTRSFVRTYARYLGLDEERIMAEFHLVGQPEADVDMRRMAALKSPVQRSGSPTTLVVLLVAGIMLSAAYLLFRYSRRSLAPYGTGRSVEVQGNPPSPTGHGSAAATPAASAGTPPSSTVQGGGQAGMPAAPAPNAASNLPGMPATNAAAPVAAAASNAPGAPTSNTNPAPATQTGTQAASSGTAEPQPSLPAQAGTAPPASKQVGSNFGLVLQVAATESTWVGIEADGQTVLQRVLKPNEVRTLKARQSFDVTTGNAQGVILTLNGETLKPLGRRGEVKSIHLTRDDLKNPAP
jgi:cytoskeleton protein RodZ